MNDNNQEIMAFAINYPINVRSLPLKGMRITIEADAIEKEKLAKNHALMCVDFFASEVQILPWKKRGVRLKGYFKASIQQACIVTLEPIVQNIEENFEAIFVPADSKLVKPDKIDESGEMFLDADGPDAPEVFYGDILNIGEVVEEFFELSIDHYPRKDNAEFIINTEENNDDKKASPFAVLKKLK